MNPASKQSKDRGRIPLQLGAIVEFIEGEDRGRRVPLLWSRTVVGRKFADILVRDVNVSGTHFAIDYRAGRFKIVDLGSSNGTFVGENRVKEAILEKEAVVRAGESALRLIFDPEEAQRLMASMPATTGRSQGGLTGLMEEEFFHSETPSSSMRPPEGATESKEAPLIRLSVVMGPDRGKSFTLEKKQVTVGRVDTDVILADRDISRKHLLIERQEDQQTLLRDLASSNGTFVNDQRVSNCVLVDGDRIRLGGTTLVYESKRPDL